MRYIIEVTSDSIIKTLDTGEKTYTATTIKVEPGLWRDTGMSIPDQLEEDDADSSLIEAIEDEDLMDIMDIFRGEY